MNKLTQTIAFACVILCTCGVLLPFKLLAATNSCLDIFPHAINSHSSAGILSQYGSFHVTDDPDDQNLPFPFKTPNNLPKDSCGNNNRCDISGVEASSGDFPSFEAPMGSLVNYQVDGTVENIGSMAAPFINQINIFNDGIVNFTEIDPMLGYRINQLNLNQGTVNLQSGDYYLGAININSNTTINIDGSQGSKQVRVHVNGNFQFTGGSINAGGDPDDLIFYIHGNANLGGNSSPVNALVYVLGTATLDNDFILSGRLSAANVTMYNNSNVTYGGELDNPGLGDFCNVEDNSCLSDAAGRVFINEVSQKGDWVELYIQQSENLQNWQLGGRGNGNSEFNITCTDCGVFANESYVIFAEDVDEDSISDAVAAGDLVLGTNLFEFPDMDLTANKEQLFLSDDNGDMVHFLHYHNGNSPIDDDFEECVNENPDHSTDIPKDPGNLCSLPDGSIDPDDWVECEDTPGEENDLGGSVHHYQIELPASPQSVCSQPEIVIKACANAACDELYTPSGETVSATFFEDKSVTADESTGLIFSNGLASIVVEEDTLQTVTYDLTIASPTAEEPLVCIGGNGSCQLVFDGSATYEWSDVTTDSCLTTNVTLTAKIFDTDMGLCRDITGPQDVNFNFSYLSPVSNPSATSLTVGSLGANVTIAQGNVGTLSVNLGSPNNVSVMYPDAGSITVTATDPLSAITSDSMIGAFVPDELTVSTAETDFIAGKTFEFNLSAACSDGTPTPNYTPGDLSFTTQMTEPSTGNTIFDGLFFYDYGQSPITISPGSTLTTDINVIDTDFTFSNYSEWGRFNLTVLDTDFFGSTLTSNTLSLGRFKATNVLIEPKNDGVLAPRVGGFKYIEEAVYYDVSSLTGIPEFTVKGLHYNGSSVLKNYPAPDVNTNPIPVISSVEDNGLVLMSSIEQGEIIDTDEGVHTYQLSSSDNFIHTKVVTPITPFTSSFSLYVESNGFTDLDGVQNSALAEVTPEGVEMRYGRFYPQQAAGAVNSAINPDFIMQYFDGSNWVLSSSDVSSTLSDAYFITEPASESSGYTSPFDVRLVSGRTPSGSVVTVNWSALATAGLFNVTLDEDGTDSGTIYFIWQAASLPVWMQANWGDGALGSPPPTPIVFGLTDGNDRMIIWREVK